MFQIEKQNQTVTTLKCPPRLPTMNGVDTMTFEIFKPERDLPKLYQLCKDNDFYTPVFCSGEYSLRFFKESEEAWGNRGVVYYRNEEGQLIGFTMFMFNIESETGNKYVQGQFTCVDAKHRHKKIGTQLLISKMMLGAMNGCVEERLETDNPDALRFFVSQKYQVCGKKGRYLQLKKDFGFLANYVQRIS